MDLSGVVACFADLTVSVIRPAADNFDVHGRPLPRTAESTFTAEVMPYPEARTLKRDDPAGFSPSDLVNYMSVTELRPRDLIQVPGETSRLEVEKVQDWSASGFYVAQCRRAQTPFEPQTGGIP